MKLSQWLEVQKGRTCTLIGAGVSHRPLCELLYASGISFTVRDRKSSEELGELGRLLAEWGIPLILGEGYLEDITEDIVFRTPGLRPDAFRVPHDTLVTSETELFLSLTPATVIGITGSDGKTTTTTLTGKLLEAASMRRECGRVFVGGNIGTPLLPLVDEMTEEDFAVLELSSFQLMTATRSPHRAALTNLSENHLDWHTGMDEYIEAKKNLFMHAPGTHLVTNAENALAMDASRAFGGHKLLFSSKRTRREDFEGLLSDSDAALYVRDGAIMLHDGKEERMLLPVSSLQIKGVHNLENMMTALGLVCDLVEEEDIRAVAEQFEGVPHRLERVADIGGVTYYNSSIDSTPSRTRAALEALSGKRPIVICGGRNKKLSFVPLAETLAEHAGAVILTGEAAEDIRAAIEANEKARELPVYLLPLFADAVRTACELAQKGDTVLLSPACTSFDAFSGYAERGRAFAELVRQYAEP